MDRKQYQLQIPLTQNVQSSMTNGFERYRFSHCALPEINFDEIDVSTVFCGKKLACPFLISSMTGGNPELLEINHRLARAAEICGAALGVGSERVLLENYRRDRGKKGNQGNLKEILGSFNVRKRAKPPLLLGNLGAIQLNNGFYFDDVKRAKELINADGIFLHLNSLQEAVQENGNINFAGVLKKIEEIMTIADFPVIIKEVGFGIGEKTALQLKKAGVKIVDVAGAGGTNWVRIEGTKREIGEIREMGENRGKKIDFKKIAEDFRGWGNQTAECVVECVKIGVLQVIASGGIRNGVEAAKAIALGASLVGIGLPLLQAAEKSESAVVSHLNSLIYELKMAMFGVGAKNLEELRRTPIVKISKPDQ